MRLPVRIPRLARDIDGGRWFESFLVSAVVSILGIRFYLEMTGYPKLGGHGLHIAHMLWGGMLMVVAIVLLLAFLGKRIQQAGAVVGGIGFGAFIDELGKFITSDNNYFYEPTFALIYVIFILMFLAFRAIERQQTMSDTEYLVNAIALLQEAVLDRVHPEQKDRALLLIQRSAANDPFTRAVRQALRNVAATQPPPPNAAQRCALWVRERYEDLIQWHWFRRAIIAIACLDAFATLAAGVTLAVGGHTMLEEWAPTFWDWGLLITATAAATLMLIGVARLRAGRLAAFTWFRRSVLFSLFLVQFFAFYEDQLGAITGLVFDLVFLAAVSYLIGGERARQATAAASAAPAAADQRLAQAS
jgi:hypothetical protein